MQERTDIAKRFFNEHLDSLADGFYLDTKRFRNDFIKTAGLSLKELPIKKWYDLHNPKEVILYRDVSSRAFPGGIQISRVLSDLQVYFIALIVTIAIITPILIIFFSIRWIIYGFKK